MSALLKSPSKNIQPESSIVKSAMKCGSGRYIFSVLACLGNMICLLGRDTMRLAILPMQEELSLSPGDVSHVLGKLDL